MNRRELLELVAAVPALRAFAESGERRTESEQGTPRTLSVAQAALVTSIADLIIPRTDTPGANDVGVTGFIDLLLTEWYDAGERDQLLAGLGVIESRVRDGGLALPALLETLDGVRGEAGSAEWTFDRLKSLIVYGYFTSEVVQRDVLHHQPLPGRFDGCVPF